MKTNNPKGSAEPKVVDRYGFVSRSAGPIAMAVGGVVLLLILPLALTLPFVLGWLRLKGEQAGLYGTQFGLALSPPLTLSFLPSWSGSAPDC
jgi:hypothetical protein